MTKPQKTYNLFKYIIAAVILHFLAAVTALALKTSDGKEKKYIWDDETLVLLKLPPPVEGEGLFISLMGEESADRESEGMNPQSHDNPEGEESIAKPAEMPVEPTPQPQPLPDDISEMLAEERVQLEKELQALKSQSLTPLPQEAPQGFSNTPRKPTGLGGKGAERDLNMDGHPPDIVNQIMNRYEMRIETKRMGGSTQNFLSSASGASGTYHTGSQVPEGIYEVWQLSRKSIAKMAHLEEEAIRAKGMEPTKTRVKRIVYGIVKLPDGSHDLGVTYFDAEALD